MRNLGRVSEVMAHYPIGGKWVGYVWKWMGVVVGIRAAAAVPPNRGGPRGAPWGGAAGSPL